MISKSKIIQQPKNNKDVITIQPDVYYDNRRENIETFSTKTYKEQQRSKNKKSPKFIVDSVSFSTKYTIRGLHGDHETYKLVQCLKGAIYVVVLDLREDSPTYKQHDAFYINDKNRHQLLIPPGCVNGHLCLSDECIFHYKLSKEYVPIDKQLSITWNDPEYNIFWPVSYSNLILSDRDRGTF